MNATQRQFKLISLALKGLLLLAVFLASSCWSEPAAVRTLVEWENQANNGRGREEPAVALTHYEIPLEFIYQDVSASMPPEVLQSLIFEKAGKKYFRWIVHPEDTRLPELIALYAKEQKISLRPKKYFEGWYTASRSLIVRDPNSEALFSAKVATNHLLGKREKKSLQIDEARVARRISDFLQQQLVQNPSPHLVLFPEVGAFGLNEAFTQRPWMSQGLAIRSLDPLLSKEFEYLPAFSAFDNKLGKAIAKSNGSNNPAEYWKKHFIEPLARANADLFARYGLTSLSPHGQNYLIEMRREGKKLVPTGRIAIRDLQEFTVINSHAVPLWGKSAKDLRKEFPYPWVTEGRLVTHEIWPLGHNPTLNAPSWLSPKEYDGWAEHYYSQFEDSVARAGFILPGEVSLESKRYGGEEKSYARTFGKTYTIRASWPEAATDLCARASRKLGDTPRRKSK